MFCLFIGFMDILCCSFSPWGVNDGAVRLEDYPHRRDATGTSGKHRSYDRSCERFWAFATKR